LTQDDLVTAQICQSLAEADVVCSMLQAYGIPAFVADRQMANAYGPMVVARRGILVRVPSWAARDAALLIADIAES
jgi:hypothetical protein